MIGFKVEKGDDIFGLFNNNVIGRGGKIPQLIANVAGIAKPRDDGGIIFEPHEPKNLMSDGSMLEFKWNGSTEWQLPGVTMLHCSNGEPLTLAFCLIPSKDFVEEPNSINVKE